MKGYNSGMDQWLPSFVDELEKIAVSRHLSTYGPQSRRGRRPIRVKRMIEKDTAFWNNRAKAKLEKVETRDDDQAKFYEHEGYRQYTNTPESGDDGSQRYFASGA